MLIAQSAEHGKPNKLNYINMNKSTHPLLYKGFLIKQDKENNKYYGHRLTDNIYLNSVYNTWPQLKSIIDSIN